MPLWQPSNAISRPEYYDRSARAFSQTYANSNAPHGVTVRVQYSPPVNFAAFIESIYLGVKRDVAAGPAADAVTYAAYTPFGGSQAVVLLAYLFNGTVNFRTDVQNNSFGFMPSGDNLSIFTFDNSVGGACTEIGTFKGVEFLYR